MRIRLSDPAARELHRTADWYEENEPDLGVRFLNAVTECFHRMSADPESFPADQASRDCRRCPVSGFPYQVLFDVNDQEIVVLAVAHNHRRAGYWRRRPR